METVAAWAERIRANVERAIYGKGEVIDLLLAALLCQGHILLEDVPGVGKTILARALASSLGCAMRRIQCTPDLMPADVVGASIYNQRTGEFAFREGPVVTNLLLVDEINRATPRTQSALLQAMEDRAITVEGERRPLPDPFLVIATENPVEFEGTFPLPEAQKDRFFLATRMGYPSEEAEVAIMESHRRLGHPVSDLAAVTDAASVRAMQEATARIPVEDAAVDFILRLVEATRRDGRLALGASPRASRALYRGAQARAALAGRSVADGGDVAALAPAILWKRIGVQPEQAFRGLTEERMIGSILAEVEQANGGGSRGRAKAAATTGVQADDRG